MLYAIVTVIAIILDQLLKYWTTTHIVLDEGIVKLIPGVIHLANVHNYGGAYNLLSGTSFARWLFIALCAALVIVVSVLIWRGKIKGRFARWTAVFVMAGALGNCIDRIIDGYVVDILELELFTFPVFNLADIFITVGAIAFCLCILLEKDGKSAPERAPRARRSRTAAETAGDDDPFAQWEVSSEAAKPEPEAAPEAKEAPAPVKKPAPKPEPKPAESAPKPEPKSAPEPAEESYDIDDILAEFRDL